MNKKFGGMLPPIAVPANGFLFEFSFQSSGTAFARRKRESEIVRSINLDFYWQFCFHAESKKARD
jgi:hypothetical protein